MSLLGTIGKIALVAAAIAVNFIPVAGQAASVAIAGGLFSAGFVTSATIVALTANIISGITLLGVTAGLGLAAQVMGAGKVPDATLSRLNLTTDPETGRKTVFGTTALASDVKFTA